MAGLGERFVTQSLGRAKVSADWITTTQIALNHFVVMGVMQRAAERAGGNAGKATDALLLVEFYRTRVGVAPQGVKQARFDTGGIVTLQTG